MSLFMTEEGGREGNGEYETNLCEPKEIRKHRMIETNTADFTNPEVNKYEYPFAQVPMQNSSTCLCIS